MVSVPLYATAAKSWAELSAAGVFVCNVTSVEHTHSAEQPMQTRNFYAEERTSRSPTAKDVHTRANPSKEQHQRDKMNAHAHRSSIQSGCEPAVKVGHVSVVVFAMLAFCFVGMHGMVGLRPQPFPLKGRMGQVPLMPGVWRLARPLQVHTSSINATVPDGNVSVAMDDKMEKEPKLGVIWGNHP
jgi:hypothetical protein